MLLSCLWEQVTEFYGPLQLLFTLGFFQLDQVILLGTVTETLLCSYFPAYNSKPYKNIDND